MHDPRRPTFFETARLSHERWQWGGRLPSERLRGVRGSNVLGLIEFDTDLVHTLDAASAEVQRAVALLATRRACEVAGLSDMPWVVPALAALTEGRPLPSPFDDLDLMWQTLRSGLPAPGPRVLCAIPPERPLFVPPTAPAPPERKWRRASELKDYTPDPRMSEFALSDVFVLEPSGDEEAASAPYTYPVLVSRVPVAPRTPEPIVQPYFALPAVLAAADPDPLKAALDAVWHALHTYGEHYPRLLEEIRSLCAEHTDE
ncbi:hypothetical protein [Streptomyces sp. NPDC059247]|uniref:hypothetical protein n=1 Tax=Streptomyces sp. NPDC059247 TaxID=3346790 RepID=UPI0036B65358